MHELLGLRLVGARENDRCVGVVDTMIPCFEAVKSINRLRGNSIVVGTMTPNRYWRLLSDRPELDLPIYGAMGKASSMALGLALARPDKKVLCMDCDGSLLMNLGSMVTIAGQQPKNLVHFVFDDEAYFTTGGQPVPGAGTYNFKVMAEGAGYKEAFLFDDLEDFVSRLPEILEREGPVMAVLKIHYPDGGPEFYMGSTRDAVHRLKEALEKE